MYTIHFLERNISFEENFVKNSYKSSKIDPFSGVSYILKNSNFASFISSISSIIMAFQLTAEDLGFEQNPSCLESTGTDLSIYCNKKRKSN